MYPKPYLLVAARLASKGQAITAGVDPMPHTLQLMIELMTNT